MGKTLVEVCWEDACIKKEEGITNLESIDDSLVEQLSYGRLIKENSKVLVIAQSENDDGFADYLVIPRGNIKYMKTYALKYTLKKKC